MDLTAGSALVTGGASGLGLATAKRLIAGGMPVVIADLPTSPGVEVAADLGPLASFAPANVTDTEQFSAAVDAAAAIAPLRVLVHCAGKGGTVRVVERDGTPGSLEQYEAIIRINLIGSFNALRLAAASMVTNEPVGDARGVCILTASVAAWEGQIGQIPYASAKAGVVGMTLVAARDLARSLVRVVSLAPGVFDTPILSRFEPAVLDRIAAQVPNPARLGAADEFAKLAIAVIDNDYINGETIRIDGAIRMQPR